MKIIKRGVIPKNRKYKTTCSQCKTTFEFLEKEAKFVPDDRDGNAIVIKCPLCKNEIWVTY